MLLASAHKKLCLTTFTFNIRGQFINYVTPNWITFDPSLGVMPLSLELYVRLSYHTKATPHSGQFCKKTCNIIFNSKKYNLIMFYPFKVIKFYFLSDNHDDL